MRYSSQEAFFIKEDPQDECLFRISLSGQRGLPEMLRLAAILSEDRVSQLQESAAVPMTKKWKWPFDD